MFLYGKIGVCFGFLFVCLVVVVVEQGFECLFVFVVEHSGGFGQSNKMRERI